jgi:hypothetical protein
VWRGAIAHRRGRTDRHPAAGHVRVAALACVFDASQSARALPKQSVGWPFCGVAVSCHGRSALCRVPPAAHKTLAAAGRSLSFGRISETTTSSSSALTSKWSPRIALKYMYAQVGKSLFGIPDCSLGLSATSQQYFSLTTNQPPATSQQYFSLRINQHQPSATSQTNRLYLRRFKQQILF